MGLGTTIWSPLYSGLLTGKYNDGIPADSRMNLPGYEWLKDKAQSPEGRRQFEGVNKLAAFAGVIGLPVHHMALLWCLANRHVSTVILGASKRSQLEDNLWNCTRLRALAMPKAAFMQGLTRLVIRYLEIRPDCFCCAISIAHAYAIPPKIETC
jgi:hypothetical protein